MIYHVAKTGNDDFPGTEAQPFFTVSRAAKLARPGDSVIVHRGIYREWVSPENSGTESERILYQAAADGEVVLSGGEQITGWKSEGDNVWSIVLDNSLFAHRNPFREELYGDWLFPGEFVPHLGDVYLNGKSLYEVGSRDKLIRPAPWPQAEHPEESLLVWYAEAGEKTTTIWANFGGADPNAQITEIPVRPYCFWPEKEGIGYITVRGFKIEMGAPQWAPPTALQEGLIGPHWSRGWIIEENEICNSKCVGVSLGKEKETGHNEWSDNPVKGGTQREQEVIFRALRKGWSKETIGSHIVRNNVIHDCEQAAIVGHLGGAFSKITGNRIYRIDHKRVFHGAEVGGIKLHAAIDVEISHNMIYGCSRGIWLDWQAQGTRISKNIFFQNPWEDLFVEVCHGPYLVDNNLFLSRMNFRNMAQGGAFVHNLFAGKILPQGELNRQTPYHFPHETLVAGYANITGGDDRYFHNLFLRDDDPCDEVQLMTFFEVLPLENRERKSGSEKTMDGVPEDAVCHLYPVGLGAYNRYFCETQKHPWEMTSEERTERMEKYDGSLYPLGRWTLPVSLVGNAYAGGAIPSIHETDARVFPDRIIEVGLLPEKDGVKIKITNPALLRSASVSPLRSNSLGRTYHAEMAYETPQGEEILFDSDFFGNPRTGSAMPGPFEITGDQPVTFVIRQDGVTPVKP